jgi:protein SCO1
MNRRRFFVGAAAAAAVPFALAPSGKAQTLPQDGVAWFTDVDVTAHDGRTFKFYDDLLKGKIVLVNFFFTRCDATCPLVMENLAAVQDLLGPRIARDIFMYSITLQPEIDTPELLAAYAKTYDAGPGWLLLTGKPNDIELLRHRLGFVESNPVEDANPEAHVAAIRIGDVPMHRWIMSPALVDPKVIVGAVKRATPEHIWA